MKKIFSMAMLICLVLSLTCCRQERLSSGLPETCAGYYTNIILQSGEFMEEGYAIEVDKDKESAVLYTMDSTGKIVNRYEIMGDLLKDILSCANKHEPEFHKYTYEIKVNENIIIGSHL